MQEEAYLKPAGSKIVEKLSRCRGAEVARRFDLHNELFVYDHVEPLRCEFDTLVKDGNGEFARDAMPARYQLAFERQRVDVLRQTIAERLEHFIESANDRVGQRLLDKATRTLCHSG